jgi:hypothetical protein
MFLQFYDKESRYYKLFDDRKLIFLKQRKIWLSAVVSRGFSLKHQILYFVVL